MRKRKIFYLVLFFCIFSVGCTNKSKIKIFSDKSYYPILEPIEVVYKPYNKEFISKNKIYINNNLISEKYQYCNVKMVEFEGGLKYFIKIKNIDLEIPDYIYNVFVVIDMDVNGKVGAFNIDFVDKNGKIIDDFTINSYKDIIGKLSQNFVMELPASAIKNGDVFSTIDFKKMLSSLNKISDKRTALDLSEESNFIKYVVAGYTVIDGRKYVVSEVEQGSSVDFTINNKMNVKGVFDGYAFFDVEKGILEKSVLNIDYIFKPINGGKNLKMKIKGINLCK